MSTLKVNKIRDTAGSADSITLDPNGGAVIAGVTTVSTVKVGSGVTITSDGDIFHTGVCTATSFSGQIPAASIVGVCTSGLTKTGGFGGITQADQWRITANFDSTDTFITSNWERNDSTFAYVGDGMTESSGVFTFPETGIYYVIAFARGYGQGSTAYYVGCEIHTTPDNSTYTNVADSYGSQAFTNGYVGLSCQTFFDVTNTSTHKVKMKVAAANTFRFSGGSNKNETGITFIRLGDT